MFTGKINAIRKGAINAEVSLLTESQLVIVATITLFSLRQMQLAVGTQVEAYVKAPWIVLHKGAQPIQSSARNQFCGKITTITRGAVNSMVNVTLSEGSRMQCVVTKEAIRELGLAPEDAVCLLFKASHVFLGIRDPAD
jgi:Molybdopterin-binding protein